MAFDGLKTARQRLIEIETEKSKVSEWKSGDSSVVYRRLEELNKEYTEIMSKISSEADLDKSLVELSIDSNINDGKLYVLQ